MDIRNFFGIPKKAAITGDASSSPHELQAIASSSVASKLATKDFTINEPNKLTGMQPTKLKSEIQKKEVAGGAAAFFGDDPAIHQQSPTKSPKRSEKKTSDVTSQTKSANNKKSPQSCTPSSASGSLEGLKIAITGVMSKMGRDEMENLIMTYGGKAAHNVSGRTDYLIIGDVLEDGRPVQEGNKYKTALEKKVKIITEEEFLTMVASASLISSDSTVTPTATLSTTSGKMTTTVTSNSSNSSNHSNNKSIKPLKKEYPTASTLPSNHSVVAPAPVNESDLLWVDRYRPQSLDEIIGCTDIVKKLSEWLKSWDAIHIKGGTTKPAFSKENANAKAVLLSGPPGIGKTTMATLVAKHLQYEVLELNASDARNKGAILEKVSDVVLSRAIGMDGSTRRRVVIMDEVDGMGGSDRGGLPELIKVIKTSKSPIICICNDRQAQKIRSLANHCYDLRVRRPVKTQIANRIIKIAAIEGLQIEQNAAELLVEQVGNDIRQVLHALQMWSAQSKQTIRYGDMKEGMSRIEKDKVLRQSPFDACLMILGGARSANEMSERYNSFFIDYSLVPLLVQQNYIDSSKSGIFKNPNLSDLEKMEHLSKASDSVSDMELLGSALRSDDFHWELLPAQAAMSVKVGSVVQGFQAFPAFPSWLGKYSTTGKLRRMTQEIVQHTSLSIGQGFRSIRLEYIPYIRHRLLQPLQKLGNEAVKEVVMHLEDYGLSKEDLMENMKELQFTVEKDKQLIDLFELVDSKVKAALTREYNSMEHTSQALASAIATKKKRSFGGASLDVDEEGLETVEDLEAAREEPPEDKDNDEDIGDVSAFVKKHKKANAKGKSSTTSSESSRGKGNSGSSTNPPSKKAKK